MQKNWGWHLHRWVVGALVGWAWAVAAVAAPVSISSSDTLSSVTGGVISLSRFDPSLGTLLSVEVEASFEGSKFILFGVFCGDGPCSRDATVAFSATAFVSLGDLELSVEQTVQRDVSCSFPSGFNTCSAPDLLLDASDSKLSTDPATLALFTGPGTFNVLFTVIKGSQGAVSSFEGQASATYVYDARIQSVPEPSSLVLASTTLLLMASGLMPGRRRRH